jgi:hypothetical protein
VNAVLPRLPTSEFARLTRPLGGLSSVRAPPAFFERNITRSARRSDDFRSTYLLQ